jgi:pimeloyl-ACP methyl ester carboxylesterase
VLPTHVDARSKRALLVAGLALAIFGGTAARAQQQSTAAVALVRYAVTKASARLPDGRTIHLVCMGQGSPVVILAAGGGDWSDNWYKVQPAVAEKTRVCAWDRAGFGMSSPTSPPQSVDKRTSDLQSALKADGIKGPFVMVGHSLGSYESLLLKDREPANVVGMVLVDPSYPAQVDEMESTRPALWAYANRPDPAVSELLTCAAALRQGTVGYGKPDPNGCMKPHWPAVLPPELRAALEKAEIEPGPQTYAAFKETDAAMQNWQFIGVDSRLVNKPDRNYGNMPLIVLTAGVDAPLPPDAPAEAKAEIPRLMRPQFARAHDALAALSTRGVNRTVPDSTHYIHQIKPEVVIDAIDEVVDAAREANR